MLPVGPEPLIAERVSNQQSNRTRKVTMTRDAAIPLLACVALGFQFTSTLAAESRKADDKPSPVTGQSERPKSAKQNEPESLSHNADGRTPRHPGYAISQQKRKRTEEPFGWGKTIGGLARPIVPIAMSSGLARDGESGDEVGRFEGLVAATVMRCAPGE
jgi:hypothetical protein